MRSNAGIAKRQGDVDLRFTQVSAPQLTLWLGLAWLGLAWLGLAWLGLAWLGLAWLGYRPSVTQTVGRGIVLLFHDRGTRRR